MADVVERLVAAGIRPDYDSIGVWEGYLQQRLLLTRCEACSYWIHFPRSLCPKCWSDDVGLHELSGRGVVYTFTVDHDRDGDSVIALVELPEQEGLRMVAPIVECDATDVSIGMEVSLTWQDFRGIPVPAFRPTTVGG
jgi:uncharacterized OB-fold protein